MKIALLQNWNKNGGIFSLQLVFVCKTKTTFSLIPKVASNFRAIQLMVVKWTLIRMETLLVLQFHEVREKRELEKKKVFNSRKSKNGYEKERGRRRAKKKRLLCPHIFYETYVF